MTSLTNKLLSIMIIKVRPKLDNDTDLLNLGFLKIFGTEIICCLTNDMFCITTEYYPVEKCFVLNVL